MDEKVRRKVETAWRHPEDRERAFSVLEQYEEHGSTVGRARVQLAMLKEADGSLEQLQVLLEMANRDFRDVVAAAEYPETMRAGGLFKADLSPPERAELLEIRKRDREQYERWLESDT